MRSAQRACSGPAKDAGNQQVFFQFLEGRDSTYLTLHLQICLNCAQNISLAKAHISQTNPPIYETLVSSLENFQVLRQANSGASTLEAGSPEQPVHEDDAHLQICREMSHWGSDRTSPTQFGYPAKGRGVIEYHDGTNSVTILSEILSRKRPRKLVRIVIEDPKISRGVVQAPGGLEVGLDEADIAYLHHKGALILPEPNLW